MEHLERSGHVVMKRAAADQHGGAGKGHMRPSGQNLTLGFRTEGPNPAQRIAGIDVERT